MKTAKEFLERLNSDEAFANEINDAVQARKDADAPDYADAFVAVAAEYGYEVTAEQVRKLREAQSKVISEEELGKVAGGTCTTWLGVTISASLSSVTATLEDSNC